MRKTAKNRKRRKKQKEKKKNRKGETIPYILKRVWLKKKKS
jgi:hypothetical protein